MSSIKVSLVGTQIPTPAGISFAGYKIDVTDAAGVTQTHAVDGTAVSFSQFDNVADGAGTGVAAAIDTSGSVLPSPFATIPFNFTAPVSGGSGTVLNAAGVTVTGV